VTSDRNNLRVFPFVNDRAYRQGGPETEFILVTFLVMTSINVRILLKTDFTVETKMYRPTCT